MRYLKTFENMNIEIGDYVICKYPVNIQHFKEIYDFLLSHVGQIKDYYYSSNDTLYEIFYDEDLPYVDDVKNKKRIFLSKKQFLYISKNKEDLEAKISAQKYNL